MKAIGKLGILKTLGDKQFAILRDDGTVQMKINIDDWLMDKIGDIMCFTIEDSRLYLIDLEMELNAERDKGRIV